MAAPAEDSPPTAGSDVRGLWRQVAFLFRGFLALRNLEVRPPSAGKLVWSGENVVLEITAPAATSEGTGGSGTATYMVIVNGARAYRDFIVSGPERTTPNP